MNKGARQYAIRQAISSRAIGSQEELRREMTRRGFTVTQATLSRDLRELGVGREAGGDGSRYVFRPGAEIRVLGPLVGAEVVSLMSSESLVVIRTLPGCANTVGEYIDLQNHADIIGTVAGDNTLLVVPSSRKKTQQVLNYLKSSLIEGRK